MPALRLLLSIALSSDMFKSSFMIPQRYFLFKFLSGQLLAGDYGPAWPEITALLAGRDDHLHSPDLNPIEQVWRVTRREKTHNHYWSGLPKLTAVLDEWFGSFAEPNEKLASLCSFAW